MNELKTVMLRFIGDNTFFGTLMPESDAREIIRNIRDGKYPERIVGPNDEWLVDLDKVWCVHMVGTEQLQQMQVEQQKRAPTSMPWHGKSGNS